MPIGLREFFADRGVFPAEIPPIEVDADEPLIDDRRRKPTEDEDDAKSAAVGDAAAREDELPERLKAAMKGTREMRAILIRDPNKMIARRC